MTQAIQNLNITHDLTIAPAVEQLELHLDNLNDTVVENYIEEIEDDLADFGGNHPIVGSDLDLRNDSIWRLYIVRVFWLIIMVIFGMVTSTIIADQAALLEEIVILAAFLPATRRNRCPSGRRDGTLREESRNWCSYGSRCWYVLLHPHGISHWCHAAIRSQESWC